MAILTDGNIQRDPDPFSGVKDVDMNDYDMQNIGFLNLGDGDAKELTISGGVITVTSSYHYVDTESDAATDDLDTINGGTLGDILTIRAESGSRDVVVKHGTGNLKLDGSADCTLDSGWDTITFIMGYPNQWFEISRSDNG